LNADIEGSDLYIFMVRHKKVINIVQGLIIIGLLIAINMYVYQDHQIKKQIKNNCGYTTSTYECVCEKYFVEDWKAFQNGDFNLLNHSDDDLKSGEVSDVKVDS